MLSSRSSYTVNRLMILPVRRVLSGAAEFHRRALPEPDVNLSIHPAPIILFALRRESGGPVRKQRRA